MARDWLGNVATVPEATIDSPYRAAFAGKSVLGTPEKTSKVLRIVEPLAVMVAVVL